MKLTLKIAAIATIALLTATNAIAQEEETLRLVPNAVKYRDAKPNAKSAGEVAVVEARALLARNGTAELEVTTGNLDTGEPSTTANITKVQTKLGEVTTNYNNLDSGSVYTLPLGKLQRYTPFEAHVNVMGLNSGNTEVLRVADVVRRRPDLRIIATQGPGAVRQNQPFSIAATIRELNGDSGARTDCVLLLQNAEIDRVKNVWVDAGDSVQCVFWQSIDHVGGAGYLIKLENTRPADWQPAINEVRGIGVMAVSEKQWELNVSQQTIHETYVETFRRSRPS